MLIYKYYAPNDYNFDALEQQYFFFNKAQFANDPFDCNPKLLEFLKPKSPYLNNLSSYDAFNQFGICCFSLANDNKHLWSLYAHSYKGFCVGFECDTFEKFFSEDISQIPLVFATYIDRLEDIVEDKSKYTKYDYAESDVNNRKKTINVDVNEVCKLQPSHREWDDLMCLLLSIKEREIWDVEEEVRLIFHSFAIANRHRLTKKGYKYEAFGYKVPMPKDCIKEIIIGHNIEQEHIIRLNKIGDNMNLENLLKTSPSSPFEIKIIPINQ